MDHYFTSLILMKITEFASSPEPERTKLPALVTTRLDSGSDSDRCHSSFSICMAAHITLSGMFISYASVNTLVPKSTVKDSPARSVMAEP